MYNPKVLFYIRRDITFKRKAIAKTDFIEVIMEECRVWKYISGELIDILIGSEFDITIADKGIQLLRPRWMSKEEKRIQCSPCAVTKRTLRKRLRKHQGR